MDFGTLVSHEQKIKIRDRELNFTFLLAQLGRALVVSRVRAGDFLEEDLFQYLVSSTNFC